MRAAWVETEADLQNIKIQFLPPEMLLQYRDQLINAV